MTARSSRAPRQRAARGASRVGERFEVEAGPVGHGGFCVARIDGRAVFVRHTLPGERVVVEITEGTEGDRFWRADAVEVVTASTDRVDAPCPYAGPGGCGGCDFQHVTPERQRLLKAEVVREQLSRLAGLDLDVVVESVPGDDGGLHWRTRQRYVALPGGGRGMRKHRSHDVVAVDECLLETREPVGHEVRGVRFAGGGDGFWQVHPGAPDVLLDAVITALAPAPGESVLDLYAGVGLFARFLAPLVTPGAVTAVEGEAAAVSDAEKNLDGYGSAVRADVRHYLEEVSPDHVDLVVLDPPRAGAKRAVVEGIVTCTPRAVAYVACDPAALARDVAIFAEHGYRMSSLRAFDLFPMTHHVECVALLESDARPE